jgi:hypothetical protein
MTKRSVSLPMYDFPEVHGSTELIVSAIAAALQRLGEDAIVDEPNNSDHAELMRYWRSDNTLLSQSCGLPFVEDLHKFVDVLGTPTWAGISDERGWYRTVIVVREALPAMSIAELEGMQPVISNPQSLSGWCSLGCVLADVTTTPSFVKPYIAAERHTGSLQLLQDGKADFASIDPGTFQLLERHRPSLTQGLRIIGRGPLVPATPIHVSKLRSASLSDIRSAMCEIFAREEMRGALAEIGMSGFAPFENEEYEVIGALVQRAQSVLPRR